MKGPVERPGFLFIGFRLRVPPRRMQARTDGATFQPTALMGAVAQAQAQPFQFNYAAGWLRARNL
jgi:hypothetical protein